MTESKNQSWPQYTIAIRRAQKAEARVKELENFIAKQDKLCHQAADVIYEQTIRIKKLEEELLNKKVFS